MFTVKVENSDGEVSMYQGEEVDYKYVQVDDYEDLQNARRNFQEEKSTGGYYTVDGNWPVTGKEFNDIRHDVKSRYCNVDENEPMEDALMRVGRVRLYGEGTSYKNVVIFAAKVFVMNAEGQTVDKLDLLR